MVHMIGIDPGVSGAVACINDKLQVYAAIDMPTRVLRPGKKSKTTGKIGKPTLEVDSDTLTHELSNMYGNCFLEEVSAMSKQGVTSTFNFGKSYGAAIAVLEALEIPTTRVTPKKWKGLLKLSSDKELSMALAYRLFPNYPFVWRNDGPAEAALIAYYGLITEGYIKLETL